MKTNRIVYGIYGASGFGKEVMPLVQKTLKENESCYFIDDAEEIDTLNGYKVVNLDKFLEIDADEYHVNIAIANGKIRKKLSLNLDSFNCPASKSCWLTSLLKEAMFFCNSRKPAWPVLLMPIFLSSGLIIFLFTNCFISKNKLGVKYSPKILFNFVIIQLMTILIMLNNIRGGSPPLLFLL